MKASSTQAVLYCATTLSRLCLHVARFIFALHKNVETFRTFQSRCTARNIAKIQAFEQTREPLCSQLSTSCSNQYLFNRVHYSSLTMGRAEAPAAAPVVGSIL